MVKLRPCTRALAAGLFLLLPALASAQHTTWYLAEGSTGPFFEQEILLVNPTDQPASVTATIYKNGLSVPVGPIAIPPRRRVTFPVNSIAELSSGETSAKIDSTVPIYVERTMYWNGRHGGHNAGAIAAPASTWYLAEGATGSFFNTFVLMVNANPAPTSVTLSLLKDDGTRVDFPYTLPANSRQSVYVNQLPGFASANFATTVTSTEPIFVERAMYWLDYAAGHDSVAVTAPATTWRFAEGFTGGDFETYFLVSNPGTTPGTVTLDFFLDNGTTVTHTLNIGATSRLTVSADSLVPDAAFGTRINSSVPVVAERAMYWGGFQEGHATAGLTAEHQSFVFAEGLAGNFGGLPYETFYLFMNSSGSPITVTGTFYREDGYGAQQQYTIPANSRFTLYGAAVPGLNGTRFGAVFQGTAPFLVERAVYWGPGRFGGHVSTGTPWAGPVGVPAAPPPPEPPGPPPPPPCSAIVCDDLNGSTKGIQHGGHFDGFGYVIDSDSNGISYVLGTLDSGYFEFEATGMRVANWDEKWKIMGMYDGNGGWTSDDPFRYTVEHRYRPDRASPWNRFLRLKVLNGSGVHGRYIETDTAPSVPWNPDEVYKFRFQWGGGVASFMVMTANGSVVGHIAQPFGNGPTYAPPTHVITVGNPIGGDHGSVPGLRIRNVRIGR